jgi:hypothetical protein
VHVNDVIIWGDEEARHAYSVYLTNTYRMVILIWMDPAIQIKQHVLNPSHLLSTMNWVFEIDQTPLLILQGQHKPCGYYLHSPSPRKNYSLKNVSEQRPSRTFTT